MPRRLAGGSGGCVFHVMNRGVRRAPLFRRPADYEAFLRVLCEAAARGPMRVLGYALMPNHWHLVLWPMGDRDLTRYVGWASLTHACRWQRAHGMLGLGPVYQGRFRAIPVEPGLHLLTVLRYVERNPARARMVDRAEDWPYSSASDVAIPDRPGLNAWPVARPERWLALVNEPEPDAALTALRQCVTTGAPYGTDGWRAETTARLGWTSGLRPVGRPAKTLRE